MAMKIKMKELTWTTKVKMEDPVMFGEEKKDNYLK